MSINYSSTPDNKVSAGDENSEKGSSPGFRHQSNLEEVVEPKADKQEFEEKMTEYRAKISEILSKLAAEGYLNLEEKHLLKTELLEVEKAFKETLAKVEESSGKVASEESSASTESLDTCQLDRNLKGIFEGSDSEEEAGGPEGPHASTIEPSVCETLGKSQINTAEHCEEVKRLTEGDRFEYRLKKFCVTNKSLIEKFVTFTTLEDSQQFLAENSQLCCEEMLTALLFQCYEYVIEEKRDSLENVVRQTILFQRMVEFFTKNSLDMQSSSSVCSFFAIFPLTDQLSIEKFEVDVNNLKENVRAYVAMIEEIKETPSKRLGASGGLVLESLPEENEESFNKMENVVVVKVGKDESNN